MKWWQLREKLSQIRHWITYLQLKTTSNHSFEGRRWEVMDTSKEEIVNLRKQINRLKISLMFTQVLMIALLLILGYQCLWSIWNYHYLLQQISMCLDSVNTVYSALQQFFATLWSLRLHWKKKYLCCEGVVAVFHFGHVGAQFGFLQFAFV